MTCRDFERRWNELLDADAASWAVPSVGEAALMAHAADCPACRPIAARYQALRRAISAWRRLPSPPADLVDRILSAPDMESPGIPAFGARRVRRFRTDRREIVRIVSGLAATILVCVGLLATLAPRLKRQAPPGRPNPAGPSVAGDRHPVASPGGGSPLDRALALATSATWDLARSASEPAARIGREVLEATKETDGAPGGDAGSPAAPDGGLAAWSIAMPDLEPLKSAPAGASVLLEQVGDRVSAGIQPLSSTARSAFGFLLGPARAGAHPHGSNPNGARSG